jgi:predicted PurR-regulated permease PerM
MNRTQIVSVFFLGLLLFIVAQVVWILLPFSTPIFWGAIVAFAFYPLYTRLLAKFGGREFAAALATTSLILLITVPLSIWVVLSLAGESFKLYGMAVDFVSTHKLDDVVARVRAVPFVHRLEETLLRFDLVRTHYKPWILSSVNALGNYAALKAGAITRNAILVPFEVFLTFFLVFFFLRDGRKIYAFVYDATPLEEEHKVDVFRQITDTFEAVIRGQILTALAQALVGLAVYLALGLPLPFLLAAMTFLVSLIPIVGAPLVWVPCVVYLAVNQHMGKAAVLFVLGLFGISMIDNFLKPLLIGEKTKLPYLLLFLGILGGFQVYGLMGMFLAPTVLSLFFVLVKIYRAKFLG